MKDQKPVAKNMKKEDSTEPAQTETRMVMLDEELSNYPYCKLSPHYFDLILSRSGYNSPSLSAQAGLGSHSR